MALSSRHLFFSALALTGIGAVVLACGSDESKFNDGTTPVGTFTDGGFDDNGDIDAGDLYANDPAPKYCGPDGGGSAPTIGGTEECPDDKNKPGCGCTTPGQTAPCWTGLRANRNLGLCKDGVATCQRSTETSYVWSKCEGEVLPVRGATGKAACQCFSEGTWNIANTSPCFGTYDSAYASYSTDPNKSGSCYESTMPTSRPDWSTDSLQVDCAGTFSLVFRIRAGDFDHPSANDCILGETHVDNVFYPKPGELQTLPALPGWIGKDSACAKKWVDTDTAKQSPGYGEMIVKGQSVLCEAIDDGNGGDYVFHRVKYCPSYCNDHADDPTCVACQKASSGTFN